MNMKVVIIGGVAGGATCAAHLRRLDEFCQITIYEKGDYISFANCGLPYYLSGEISDKRYLILQTPASFKARFNVDVRLKCEVLKIDTDKKELKIRDLASNAEFSDTYDKLVIATGGKLIAPNIPGIEFAVPLRTINDAEKIKEELKTKKSAAIIGGGYIGLEAAENIKKAGCDVTIIEGTSQVMNSLDYDMAQIVKHTLLKNGVNLYLDTFVEGIKKAENGYELALSNGEMIKAGFVVLATGIRPDNKLAKDAGIKLGDTGGILVNESMQTSHKDIYAVGDAVEVEDIVLGTKTLIPLAGLANKQGVIAADNICGINNTFKGAQGSSIIRLFDKTIAQTGKNEKQLKGIKYHKIHIDPFSNATYFPGAKQMILKVIFDDDGTILGSQIIGEAGVDKRCDIMSVAIRQKMKISDLKDLELCYSPPYGSAKDPINMAGYVGENLLTGKAKFFYVEDIDNLIRQKAFILDVRTPYEYNMGHIEGAVNIEVDKLRDNLHLLPRDKDIYLYCQVGVRGHVAAMILKNHGFSVYNLSGGMKAYLEMTRKI